MNAYQYPAAPPAYAGTQADPTAVMGRRTGAWVIDFLLWLVLAAFLGPTPLSPFAEYVDTSNTPNLDCEVVRRAADTSSCLEIGDRLYFTENGEAAIGFVVLWIAAPLVFAALQGATGRSAGKAAFGVKVVDEQGGTPGFGKSLSRTVLWIVDGIPCFVPAVGFVCGLTSTGHRRVGDMAAKTFVVANAHNGPVVVAGLAPPAGTGYPGYGAPGQPSWGVPGGAGPGGQPGQPWGAPVPGPPTAAPGSWGPPAGAAPGAPPAAGAAAAAGAGWAPPGARQASGDTPPPASPLAGSPAAAPPPGAPPAAAGSPGAPSAPPESGSETPAVPVDAPTADAGPPSDTASGSPGPGDAPSSPPTTAEPSPSPAPGPESAQPAEPAAAQPAPAPQAAPSSYNPQWDAARGTYIVWEPNRGKWLGWDEPAKEWKPL